mmetsp:Transcript_75092/g.208840  ORF Transcript_75092/g.208840 Transcript_75092/m.208840 type:complete len:320 (+) Transcript_75092:90-1049(+)
MLCTPAKNRPLAPNLSPLDSSSKSASGKKAKSHGLRTSSASNCSRKSLGNFSASHHGLNSIDRREDDCIVLDALLSCPWPVCHVPVCNPELRNSAFPSCSGDGAGSSVASSMAERARELVAFSSASVASASFPVGPTNPTCSNDGKLRLSRPTRSSLRFGSVAAAVSSRAGGTPKYSKGGMESSDASSPPTAAAALPSCLMTSAEASTSLVPWFSPRGGTVPMYSKGGAEMSDAVSSPARIKFSNLMAKRCPVLQSCTGKRSESFVAAVVKGNTLASLPLSSIFDKPTNITRSPASKQGDTESAAASSRAMAGLAAHGG